MNGLISLLERSKILPVLTVESAEQAVQTARALQAGGLPAVEITLRTPAALEAISAVKSQLPEMSVGAGTIKDAAGLRAVVQAGADFGVSPGFTRDLANAAKEAGLPFLPGVATPSEILEGMSLGFEVFKLFPAEAVGGLPLLKSLAAPFEGIRFCPTGGINAANVKDYLALPNVICVGGSWMVQSNLIRSGNWSEIERLARESIS